MKNLKKFADAHRRASAKLLVGEWMAVETILRNLSTHPSTWTPGSLAYALFREEPPLVTQDIVDEILHRRWPRHVLRYAEKAGASAPRP